MLCSIDLVSLSTLNLTNEHPYLACFGVRFSFHTVSLIKTLDIESQFYSLYQHIGSQHSDDKSHDFAHNNELFITNKPNYITAVDKCIISKYSDDTENKHSNG